MGVAQRLIITGRVQGVGYRAWAVEQATMLGLTGFVRNRRDGSVEAVVQGPADRVERFVAACRRGPRLARVEGVDTTPSVLADAAPGFRELPSA